MSKSKITTSSKKVKTKRKNNTKSKKVTNSKVKSNATSKKYDKKTNVTSKKYDDKLSVIRNKFDDILNLVKSNKKVVIVAGVVVLFVILILLNIKKPETKIADTSEVAVARNEKEIDDGEEISDTSDKSKDKKDDDVKEAGSDKTNINVDKQSNTSDKSMDSNMDKDGKTESTDISETKPSTERSNDYVVVPRLEDTPPIRMVPDWASTDLHTRDVLVNSYLNAIYGSEPESPYKNFNLNSYNMGLKGSYSFMNDLVLCGDSYCGRMSQYVSKYLNYGNIVYAIPGQTVMQNKHIYEQAIDSKYPIVMLCTSVNDVLQGTELKDFKETLESLFKRAYEKNKIMIVHSHVDFGYLNEGRANDSFLYKYKPKHYDAIVKRSAMKFGNVIYVECNDLATSDNLQDSLHYGDNFYSQLLPRIEDALLARLR